MDLKRAFVNYEVVVRHSVSGGSQLEFTESASGFAIRFWSRRHEPDMEESTLQGLHLVVC